MKIYRVKETPIYKKGKLYKKGEVFPFDKSDKILIDFLTVTDNGKEKTRVEYPDSEKEEKTKTKQ